MISFEKIAQKFSIQCQQLLGTKFVSACYSNLLWIPSEAFKKSNSGKTPFEIMDGCFLGKFAKCDHNSLNAVFIRKVSN